MYGNLEFSLGNLDFSVKTIQEILSESLLLFQHFLRGWQTCWVNQGHQAGGRTKPESGGSSQNKMKSKKYKDSSSMQSLGGSHLLMLACDSGMQNSCVFFFQILLTPKTANPDGQNGHQQHFLAGK